MSEFISALEDFFSTDFWHENLQFLRRSDVSFHEAKVSTSIHPLAIEYLFADYLRQLGRDVRNVGHAVVGDTAYIKYYPVERPVFNLVWRYDPSVIIAPFEEDPFSTWTDDGERGYLDSYPFRRLEAADKTRIEDYFSSSHWSQMLQKFANPEIEHFHIYLKSNVHPHDLGPPFESAIREAGYALHVPTYYLARPDIDAMWIGIVADGKTSLEVCCYFDADTAFQIKDMTEDERVYGGDGWTISDLKEFIRREDYQLVTLNEARFASQRGIELLEKVSRTSAPIRG